MQRAETYLQQGVLSLLSEDLRRTGYRWFAVGCSSSMVVTGAYERRQRGSRSDAAYTGNGYVYGCLNVAIFGVGPTFVARTIIIVANRTARDRLGFPFAFLQYTLLWPYYRTETRRARLRRHELICHTNGCVAAMSCSNLSATVL